MLSLETKNSALSTVDKYRRNLNHFIQWCEDRSLSQAIEITRPILERYQRHLFTEPTEHGNSRSFNDQHQRLSAIRCWFKWLARQRHLLHNPASEIELPKLASRLPKHVLNVRRRLNRTNPQSIDEETA